MRITDLYVSYLKATRTIQIISILAKHAFREIINRSLIGRRIRQRRIRRHKPVCTTQERLRLAIEDLGPTYIKFGQILADRRDVLPERFRKELKKLQTNALPFDDNLALQLIENELGIQVNDVFSEFDLHCMASASIGQIYTAKLKDGKDVVVKIRRPNIDRKIKLDLTLMRCAAKRLAQKYPEMAAINITGIIDEFGEEIFRELDYDNEAANLLRFQEMFRNSPHVYIPHVYMKYTTHRLIVMERIFGVSPDNPTALRKAGFNLEQIALNGAEALLTMIFKEGLFHADPHAGNLFILPDNRVAFIDFGMVGVLRPREMNFLAHLSISFARRDPISMADSVIRLCEQRFFEQRDDLIFSLHQMLKRYAHVPVEKFNYAQIIGECIDLITQYRLCLPTGIFMLAKALATIQKVAERLYPDIPFAKLIIPYARNVVMARFSARNLAAEAHQTLKSVVTLLKTAPSDISEILYKLKQGEIKHELHFTDLSAMRRMLRNSAARIAYALLLVGLFIGAIELLNKRPDLRYGHFLFFISSCLIFIVILKWLFSKQSK